MKWLPPRATKGLLIGAALAVVVFVGEGVYRAGFDPTGVPGRSQEIRFDRGAMRGERITARSWSLDYDTMVANADQSVFTIDGIHNGVIFRNGKPYLKIAAKHVTVNIISHDFTATGPLHIETIDRTRTFDTDAANWTDGTQHLDFPSPITLTYGNRPPLRIGRMSYDIAKGEYRAQNVEGVLPL